MVKSNSSSEKRTTKSTKAGLSVRASLCEKRLKNSRYTERVGNTTPIQLAATIQYILTEILKRCGEMASNSDKIKMIKPQHVTAVIRSDLDLSRVFAGDRVLFGDKMKRASDELVLDADKKYKELVKQRAENAQAA